MADWGQLGPEQDKKISMISYTAKVKKDYSPERDLNSHYWDSGPPLFSD
jgi:hypothetical protein